MSKCFNAVREDAVVMLKIDITHELKASALCNREHYHSIRVLGNLCIGYQAFNYSLFLRNLSV